MIAAYTPHLSKLPILKVPEYRIELAHYWFTNTSQPYNPGTFLSYYYWIQRCENDGSDY